MLSEKSSKCAWKVHRLKGPQLGFGESFVLSSRVCRIFFTSSSLLLSIFFCPSEILGARMDGIPRVIPSLKRLRRKVEAEEEADYW